MEFFYLKIKRIYNRIYFLLPFLLLNSFLVGRAQEEVDPVTPPIQKCKFADFNATIRFLNSKGYVQKLNSNELIRDGVLLLKEITAGKHKVADEKQYKNDLIKVKWALYHLAIASGQELTSGGILFEEPNFNLAKFINNFPGSKETSSFSSFLGKISPEANKYFQQKFPRHYAHVKIPLASSNDGLLPADCRSINMFMLPKEITEDANYDLTYFSLDNGQSPTFNWPSGIFNRGEIDSSHNDLHRDISPDEREKVLFKKCINEIDDYLDAQRKILSKENYYALKKFIPNNHWRITNYLFTGKGSTNLNEIMSGGHDLMRSQLNVIAEKFKQLGLDLPTAIPSINAFKNWIIVDKAARNEIEGKMKSAIDAWAKTTTPAEVKKVKARYLDNLDYKGLYDFLVPLAGKLGDNFGSLKSSIDKKIHRSPKEIYANEVYINKDMLSQVFRDLEDPTCKQKMQDINCVISLLDKNNEKSLFDLHQGISKLANDNNTANNHASAANLSATSNNGNTADDSIRQAIPDAPILAKVESPEPSKLSDKKAESATYSSSASSSPRVHFSDSLSLDTSKLNHLDLLIKESCNKSQDLDLIEIFRNLYPEFITDLQKDNLDCKKNLKGCLKRSIEFAENKSKSSKGIDFESFNKTRVLLYKLRSYLKNAPTQNKNLGRKSSEIIADFAKKYLSRLEEQIYKFDPYSGISWGKKSKQKIEQDALERIFRVVAITSGTSSIQPTPHDAAFISDLFFDKETQNILNPILRRKGLATNGIFKSLNTDEVDLNEIIEQLSRASFLGVRVKDFNGKLCSLDEKLKKMESSDQEPSKTGIKFDTDEIWLIEHQKKLFDNFIKEKILENNNLNKKVFLGMVERLKSYNSLLLPAFEKLNDKSVKFSKWRTGDIVLEMFAPMGKYKGEKVKNSKLTSILTRADVYHAGVMVRDKKGRPQMLHSLTSNDIAQVNGGVRLNNMEIGEQTYTIGFRYKLAALIKGPRIKKLIEKKAAAAHMNIEEYLHAQADKFAPEYNAKVITDYGTEEGKGGRFFLGNDKITRALSVLPNEFMRKKMASIIAYEYNVPKEEVLKAITELTKKDLQDQKALEMKLSTRERVLGTRIKENPRFFSGALATEKIDHEISSLNSKLIQNSSQLDICKQKELELADNIKKLKKNITSLDREIASLNQRLTNIRMQHLLIKENQSDLGQVSDQKKLIDKKEKDEKNLLKRLSHFQQQRELNASNLNELTPQYSAAILERKHYERNKQDLDEEIEQLKKQLQRINLPNFKDKTASAIFDSVVNSLLSLERVLGTSNYNKYINEIIGKVPQKMNIDTLNFEYALPDATYYSPDQLPVLAKYGSDVYYYASNPEGKVVHTKIGSYKSLIEIFESNKIKFPPAQTSKTSGLQAINIPSDLEDIISKKIGHNKKDQEFSKIIVEIEEMKKKLTSSKKGAHDLAVTDKVSGLFPADIVKQIGERLAAINDIEKLVYYKIIMKSASNFKINDAHEICSEFAFKESIRYLAFLEDKLRDELHLDSSKDSQEIFTIPEIGERYFSQFHTGTLYRLMKEWKEQNLIEEIGGNHELLQN